MESTENTSAGGGPPAGHAIAQLPVVLWTTDPELRFTSSEGGGLAKLGLEPGQVVGLTLFEYFGTDDPASEPIAGHLQALQGLTGDYETTWEGRAFRTHVEPLRDGAGNIVGTTGFAIDVTGELEAKEAVLERDRIVSAVSSAAGRLLGAPWEDVVPGMLADLALAADVSRIYVFENTSTDDGSLRTRMRHEWVADGVRPFIAEALLHDFQYEQQGMSRWADVLGEGGVVAGNVADLPRSEQPVLQAQAIVSICVVPIEVGGRWWGLLGFDECRHERSWSEAEIGELRTAAAALGAAISRERAEEATREAEERYRTLVEQLPVVVYRDAIDATSTALYISPQYERMFGFPPEARLRDPDFWISHLHPDDRDRIVELSGWTNETGEPFSAEYRFIGRDGRIVWVRDEAQLLRDAEGRPLLWQGVLIDVTARKHAEAALARRDAILEAIGFAAQRFLKSDDWESALPEALGRLGTASNASRAYVYEKGTLDDGRPAVSLRGQWAAPGIGYIDDDVNRHYLYDQGFSRWEEVLSAGKEIHGQIHDFPEDERPHLEHEGVVSLVVLPVFAGDEWWGFLGFDDFASERVWPRAEVEALRTAADTLGAAIGRTRAERLRAEAQAEQRQLEARTRAVLDSALEAIVTMDEHGRIVDFNPAAERMFGHRREDVAGKSLADTLIPPEIRARHRSSVAAYLETRAPSILHRQLEVEALRSDGERFPVEITVTEVQVSGTTLFTGFIRDLTERREAERLLHESEEQYRALVEAAPAVVYRMGLDEAWPILFVSPSVQEVLGEPPEWWTDGPRSWRAFIHPGDVAAADRETRRAVESGEAFGMEYRVVRPDGGTIWIYDNAVLVRDAEGEPSSWQGIFVDLSPQKELEQARRKSELHYRSVVENVPVITYVEGPGGLGDPRFISPQVGTILGYTPEEWHARQRRGEWMQLIHPDDLDALLAEEEGTQDSGEPFHAEYRVRAKDGRWVWLLDDAVPIRDEGGEVLFWQGVQQDITERRRAEEAIRQGEARYRAIVEHVPAAIYVDVPDPSMDTLYVSPQIEQIMGVPSDEYLSDPNVWLKLMPDEAQRAEMRDSYLEAIEQRRPWKGEYLIRRPDGREVWVHDETTLLYDESGEPLFVQGVMFDITERKLAEQALLESERREREAAERLRAIDEMKNTFLAAVSHELRTPLTSILGLALTLERQELPADEQPELLGRLARNARKLDLLLKDLLDIDRLARGVVTPKMRRTDLGAIVRGTVEDLEVLGERSVLVQTDSVVVPCDPPKIERIVENLVMNAVRHTPSDAGMWIKVWAQDGGALIAVEDDGPGVPKELWREIFEPFRQGTAPSPHAPGTGIGLSLVAMFADLHGGRAWVQDREGGGASFRVFLPGERDAPPSGNGHGASPVERAAAG